MNRPLSARPRRLLLSAAAKWGGFAMQVAVAFVMAPLLIRALGDQRYGVWSLVESILAYLLLFDFGIAASLVRYVARFEAGADQERVNRVFSTCLVMGGVAGAAVLVLTCGLTIAAGWLQPSATAAVVGLGGSAGGAVVAAAHAQMVHEGRWMLALLGVNLALGLPLRTFTCVVEGLGHYPAQAAIRVGCLAVRTALVVVVIRHEGGLVPLALAITAFTLLEHLLGAAAGRYYMPGLRFAFALADRETFHLIRGYSLHAFLAMLAGRIAFQSNALVIGAYLTTTYITYYAIAARLVEYAKDSLSVATTVLTPAASALEAQGDEDALRRMLLTSTRWVLWVILPVQLGLWLLGGTFIALWVGPRYVATSYPILAILAAPLAFAMAQSVSARFLYGLGRLKWYARFMLVEAGTNLLLSLLLVPWLGTVGVALGTAIPNVLSNLAVMLTICRVLHIDPRTYLRQVFARPLAGAALLGAAWWLMVGRTAPTTWGAFVLTGFLGVAGYGVCAALLEFGPRAVATWLRDRLCPPEALSRVVPGRSSAPPPPAPRAWQELSAVVPPGLAPDAPVPTGLVP